MNKNSVEVYLRCTILWLYLEEATTILVAHTRGKIAKTDVKPKTVRCSTLANGSRKK